jgi:hypothetical protein
LVAVDTGGSFSASKMNFVYNVLSSGNIKLISTGDISSNVTVTDCTFSVNGSGGVVPQSFITHYGGRIVIKQSSFTSISLSSHPLISFLGLFFFCALFFMMSRCIESTPWSCGSTCFECH